MASFHRAGERQNGIATFWAAQTQPHQLGQERIPPRILTDQRLFAGRYRPLVEALDGSGSGSG